MMKVLGAMVSIGCFVAAAQGGAAAPSCSLVPGWTQTGAARSYTFDNLYEYMDGNSEGYFLYNFQSMRGVTCKKGDATFVLDVSDMGDSESAYGMFTATRDPLQPDYKVGTAGQILSRRMLFAKDKYYLEISAEPEADYTSALKEWAAALDKAYPGSTSLPAALGWFPSEKQQRLRLVPKSVLGYGILKRGYVADYDFGKAFVVIESTPASASEVIKQFQTRFPEAVPAKLGEEAFQVADKYLGRLFVFRTGRYIAGYAITEASADPATLSAQLAAKLK
jgi:hypothetical protein